MIEIPMTIQSPSYHSIKNVTIALIILTVVLIASLGIFTISLAFPQLWFLAIYASFPGLIGAIVVPLLSLYWYFRATKNIHSFGAKEITSPKMAVLWWFVPIFQLWKPYFVSQQIWKASDPQIKLVGGTEWRNRPSLNLIKMGWLLFIIAAIGSTSISIIHDFTTEEIDNYLIYNILGEKDPMLKFLNVVFEIILIITLIFYVIMIRKISVRQELKSGTSI